MKQLIKGPFWSNCMIEALKAKLHNPKGVHITFMIVDRIIPHFMWEDETGDYDFGIEEDPNGIYPFWFQGYIRKRGNGFNAKYKKHSLRKQQVRKMVARHVRKSKSR